MPLPPRFPRSFFALLLALSIAPGSVGSVAAQTDDPAFDWVLGLSYGVGRASVDLDTPTDSADWARGASPQVRFGRRLGRHFVLGLENRQWLNEGGLGDLKLRGNVQSVNVVLTAYPWRAVGSSRGFFAEIGAGYGHGRITALEPVPVDEQEWGETFEEIYKHDASGWSATFGLGYEVRFARHFAAGLVVSFNMLRFDDEVFDRADFVPGGLIVNWYF